MISHSEQTAGGFLAPGKAAFLKTKTHYVTHPPPPHPPPPIHICLTHFLSMHFRITRMFRAPSNKQLTAIKAAETYMSSTTRFPVHQSSRMKLECDLILLLFSLCRIETQLETCNYENRLSLIK